MARLIDADELRLYWDECKTFFPDNDPKRAQFDAAIYDLDNTMTANGWIPVSVRFPADDEIVLVTAQPKKGEPNVNRAYYMDGAWHGSGSMSNVTAWMPMPEPYKEVE